MLALSNLHHFSVHPPSGPRWHLHDLTVQLGDVDYPAVTYLLVSKHAGGHLLAVPWAQVAAADAEARTLRLSAPPDPASQATVLPPDAVWLLRDVHDALILDLQGRRVTRANDLWLDEADGALRLVAAETGVQAVLRRLLGGRGTRGPEGGRAHTDWKYAEFLRGTPESVPDGAAYHRRIVHLPPGDIAGLTQAMPYLHVAELLSLLPTQLAADTLERMGAERRLPAFEELHEPYAAEVLAAMAPDVAADLLGVVETALAGRLLEALPAEAHARLIDLLRYPEDTVGGMMTNDFVSVPASLTAAQARQALRPTLRRPDFVNFIYVLETDAPDAKLRGVLSLRELVVAEDAQPLAELLNPYLITLSPLEPARPAAHRLLASQLAALPVVGSAGQLLGVVTVDAAVAEVAPRGLTTPRVFA